jgi:hypothetical protein
MTTILVGLTLLEFNVWFDPKLIVTNMEGDALMIELSAIKIKNLNQFVNI